MKSINFLRLFAVVILAEVSSDGPFAAAWTTQPTKRSPAINYNAVAPSYVPLRKVSTYSEDGSKKLKRLVSNPADPDRNQSAAVNLANVRDLYYVVDITVGDQILPLLLDTGSSDTWFVQHPFYCLNFFMNTQPPEKCGLGAGFSGNFSQGTIPDRTFMRSYGDGTFVGGFYGFEDVTIAGVTAEHQQLAIVNYTYWFGDGRTSGLLGLAYPLMTGIPGSDPDDSQYDPIFTTLWKRDLVPPLFTLALSRDDKDGDNSYLAFGGIPPVKYDNTTWAATPIQPMRTLSEWQFDGISPTDHGIYVITPEAYVYGRQNKTLGENVSTELVTNTTQFPISVDCGSTLTRLPTDLAESIYALFDPPAEYLSRMGLYYAPCDAAVPTFGVKIDGQVFYISPEDLLRQGERDEATGLLCRVGIMESNSGPHVLGITFLTNVVAVFDVGNTEMRFAARSSY